MIDKSAFIARMKEAKERKKAYLEQQRLEAEFMANPPPPNITVVVKTDAEIKMDRAFSLLQEKLRLENQSKQDQIASAIKRITDQSQGI